MIGTEKSTIDISIVLPALNQEGNLDELHQRLGQLLLALQKGCELIFVDDGSSDRSLELMRKLAEQDHNMATAGLTRNFGQRPASAAGTFILPPVKAEAMYDPSFPAISDPGRVTVVERK